MNYSEIRSRIRAFIFAITGFIAAFLFLRITLDLISADPDNILVSIVNQITNPLVLPFNGLVILPQTGILTLINMDATVAFIVYVLAAIAISEFITAFIFESFKDIFQNIVDALFKFLEAFLILRIVFDLFGVGLNLHSPQFVKIVYGFTQWAQGIIFEQPFLSGKINFSTILCLVIVVILDLLTERFLESIFIRVSVIVKDVNIPLPKINLTTMIPKIYLKKETVVQSQEIRPQPLQQNITINIPVPQNGIISSKPEVIVQNTQPQTKVSSGLPTMQRSNTVAEG